ncbi:hypothetical protein CDAR_7071 [Caerostris darwini]|uniref:Uncharacterized protein n=1 Tax=Caerostris darwini TaxID=1538125 RepID=A0AAV4PIW3_9ARAC|nr:hypothetical protein CDAR_7071 [Caerostris darwini]
MRRAIYAETGIPLVRSLQGHPDSSATTNILRQVFLQAAFSCWQPNLKYILCVESLKNENYFLFHTLFSRNECAFMREGANRAFRLAIMLDSVEVYDPEKNAWYELNSHLFAIGCGRTYTWRTIVGDWRHGSKQSREN